MSCTNLTSDFLGKIWCTLSDHRQPEFVQYLRVELHIHSWFSVVLKKPGLEEKNLNKAQLKALKSIMGTFELVTNKITLNEESQTVATCIDKFFFFKFLKYLVLDLLGTPGWQQKPYRNRRLGHPSTSLWWTVLLLQQLPYNLMFTIWPIT